jgi:hypothetical protein
MRPPPTLSILVVSYNTREMTLACLASAIAETRTTAAEIIVVDNASSDGSADAVARHFPGIRLVRARENLGFAAANNLAAREARGAYLLLLNPDTVVRDAAIDRLVDFARRRPEALLWGGRTVFADGRLNPSSCWGRMTVWNQLCRAGGLTGLFPASALFNGEALGGFARDREREVDIVSGCFLLVTRALWERLGGFDPVFFMYGEEADLCLRARRLGARPRFTPEATIVHHGGASETARLEKMVKLLAAKATLIDRHWHPLLAPLGRRLLALWPLSRWLARAAQARLSGRERPEAATWRAIHEARARWQSGYGGKARSEVLAAPRGLASTPR